METMNKMDKQNNNNWWIWILVIIAVLFICSFCFSNDGCIDNCISNERSCLFSSAERYSQNSFTEYIVWSDASYCNDNLKYCVSGCEK